MSKGTIGFAVELTVSSMGPVCLLPRITRDTWSLAKASLDGRGGQVSYLISVPPSLRPLSCWQPTRQPYFLV